MRTKIIGGKQMRTKLVAILIALTLVLTFVTPVLGAASQNVTVTVTPEFIAIANAPADWEVNNEVAGSGVVTIDTLYYSNPLGDATIPTVGGAVDGECRFTITNTSTVVTDLTVLFPHHAAGDASTNSDTGANAAGSFGAYSYFSGQIQGAWVIAKNAGSAAGKEDLAATTDIKWGLIYETQTGAWTSGTPMTSTVSITATAA